MICRADGLRIELLLDEERNLIRKSVRDFCAKKYPSSYWRDLDRKRGYPEEFVKDLTEGRFPVVPNSSGVRRLRSGNPRSKHHSGRDKSLRWKQRSLPRADVHHGYSPETW